MCNDNGEKSALEESIDKLNDFLEKVKNKRPDIYANHKNPVEHSLKYQSKFVEFMKNFNCDEDIFDDLNNLRLRDGRIKVNFCESLKDFIVFYEEVAGSGSFTTTDLLLAWNALEYQVNLTTRMEKTDLDMMREGACGRRPLANVKSPDKP